jgi:hypothetical protein
VTEPRCDLKDQYSSAKGDAIAAAREIAATQESSASGASIPFDDEDSDATDDEWRGDDSSGATIDESPEVNIDGSPETSIDGPHPRVRKRSPAAKARSKALKKHGRTVAVKHPYPSLRRYDAEEFELPTTIPDDGSPVAIKSMPFARSFSVPPSRVNSALKNMHSSKIRKVLKPSSCACGRQCHLKFTTMDIIDARLHYLSYPSEEACNLFIIGEMTRYASLGGFAYYLTQTSSPAVQCCPMFFRSALGFSAGKLQACRERTRSGASGAKTHGNTGKSYHTKRQAAIICKAFWIYFYDLRCQKPNDDLWLAPSNLTHQYIYTHEFLPYCEKTLGMTALNAIGRSSFENASKHSDFDYIKKRAKHRHLRCQVICLYSSSSIYIPVDMYINLSIYLYVCVCICICMYVYVCMYMYVYVYVYVCICMYVYVYVYVCIYLIDRCMYVCMYIYMYMHVRM